jgi:signal transduction histidine kinase
MLNEKFFEKIIGNLDTAEKINIQAILHKIANERSFFQMVFNAIKEGIVVIGGDRKIQYVNRAAKVLIGIPDDYEQINIQLFFRDLDWDNIQSTDGIWDKNIKCEVEILYPVKQLMSFSLVPLADNDNKSALIILQNITESKVKTKAIIESEKMHMVSLLAAEVAHEIGNPLNSLNIYLQLLKRNLNSETEDREEALDLLSVASSEVERLDKIINQFLSALRSEKPHFERIDLKSTIIETLSLLRYEIEAKNLEVKCEWPETLPGINGDNNQLQQAFYNVINNAIQAMTENGKLKIKCFYNDENTIVQFSDSGKGISHEDIHNIFEPFYTTKQSGNGLGMMIIERIIREHGAEIEINSSPGSQTSVIIKFPRNIKRFRQLPSAEDSENDRK